MLSVALVGHVDHGKSTLIGRLLYDTNSLPEGKIEEIERTCKALGRKLEFAYICDALEEERKNQMTIETSQVFIRTKERAYAIIDAPGHKEFLKNMATGVSQADAAILVIDAKEGIKEQTKRHAYLLKLLGISKVIVAVNKMDLVGFEKRVYDEVKEEMLRYLREIGVTPSFVIPVSASNGDNVVNLSKAMSWYGGITLLKALDSLEVAKKVYDLRLPIQDQYKGIYVGNILAGEIRKGEEVNCYPNGIKVRIKRIFYGRDELESASAPKAIGIATDKKLERGFVLAKNSEPIVTKEISSIVFCLVEGIEEGKEYVLRCSAQEVRGRVEKIFEKINVESLERSKGAKQLNETEIGKLKISLEKSMVTEKFNNLKELGRFVILKGCKIVGGGIVS